jgi:hypothetical protein
MWEPVSLNCETKQAINNKEVLEINYKPPKYISQPSSSAEFYSAPVPSKGMI